MTGILETYDGQTLTLPTLSRWNLHFTGGVPCDSFSVDTQYLPEMRELLPRAVRFRAREGGTDLFYGVVDEIERKSDGGGQQLTVSGRGMAALLLDNESERVTYQHPCLQDLIRTHVAPYGLKVESRELKGETEYVVESGASQWKALSSFTSYFGGYLPRFTGTGTLLLFPEEQGTPYLLRTEQAVACALREKRYGVISEVLVIDKTQGTRQTVQNQDLIRRGGCCRRVIYTPGKSSFRAMRYTGEYQIRKSEQGAREAELTLAEMTSLRPGDRVSLTPGALGLQGIYRVNEVKLHAGEDGLFSVLVLEEDESRCGYRDS